VWKNNKTKYTNIKEENVTASIIYYYHIFYNIACSSEIYNTTCMKNKYKYREVNSDKISMVK